jgi:hypothetical protein
MNTQVPEKVAFQTVPENRMAIFSKEAGAMLVNFQRIIDSTALNITRQTVFLGK